MVVMARQAQTTKSKARSIAPPVRGWTPTELTNAKPGGALVLENWFPTRTGARLRGGCIKYATLSTDPVERMWTYKSGSSEKFFASDAGNIFDITTVADASVIPTPAVTGRTSGYYSNAQLGTAGGDYQYSVNGTDDALLYDGTTFYPITGAAIYGLAYDAETAGFTQGATVTGGTSGATAEIVKVIDAGTTGTLWVRGITGGPFQNNETITDGDGGSATADIPSGVTTVQSITITGVDTSDLSYVWSFASRLFFVKKNTPFAYYLPVDSIGGALSQLSLAGVFLDGGFLSFGASFSIDSGTGLDDYCIFVSSTGEVVAFQGSNPSDATTWSRVGNYQISPTMGINGHTKAGGDILVATEIGVVPLSEAFKKDVAALSIAAVSEKIEPEWKNEVSTRSTLPWEIMKWPTNNMMVVSLPVPNDGVPSACFVANLETGAWCKFTGWDTRCIAHFDKFGFFGATNGKVYRMDIGGSDDGTPYVCTYVGSPDFLGAGGSHKVFHSMRSTFQSASPFKPKISASVDYNIVLPTPPSSEPNYSISEWDVAIWDTSKWDTSAATITQSQWKSVGRSGFAISPQIQITVGTTAKPIVSLVASDAIYEVGGVVV